MIYEPNCILRLVGILGNINMEQLLEKKTGGQYGPHSYSFHLHRFMNRRCIGGGHHQTFPFYKTNSRPMENNMKNVVASARTHAALHLQPPCCCQLKSMKMPWISPWPQVVPFQAFLSKGLPKLTMTSSPEENWCLATSAEINRETLRVNRGSLPKTSVNPIQQTINQATNTFKITLLRVFCKSIHSFYLLPSEK